MSKADNNNNYNYKQIADEKYTGWKQYVIFGLEVWACSLE